ncbi:YjbH domain-containing protein [Marseilla massiliensis]|nr:YjbH domain-containing protein [Marseilla massiliensis]
MGDKIHAQAMYGTTGLLHASTAEMQRDKTVMAGGNVLHLTPLHYFNSNEIKYTFNYFLNISIFPWLEVGYTCTINYAEHGSTYFPESVWGKYSNQDRAFYGRLRLWKEGWWKPWTPQIVFGANDPGTHESAGGGGIGSRDSNGGNCWFTRWYLASTKHFTFENIGTFGVHLSFIWDRGLRVEHKNSPAGGLNFRPNLPDDGFWRKAVNGLNLMAEYDSRTFNVGGTYSIWKDRINLVAELNGGKYFSGEVYFKVCLK